MMFLTHEELVELTGKRVRSAQVKALNTLGITHKVRADGSVVVLRSHIEMILDGVPKGVKSVRHVEPNWSAVK